MINTKSEQSYGQAATQHSCVTTSRTWSDSGHCDIRALYTRWS